MLGKKSSEKSAKNFFLYSHEYRDQNMGGQNERNNFSRNTRIVREKNVGKKYRLKKVRKNVFYIHTNTMTKKWGRKTRETNYEESNELYEQNML